MGDDNFTIGAMGSEYDSGPITIDMSSASTLYSYNTTASYNYANVTINSGAYLTSNGGSSLWSNASTQPTLTVTGKAHFEDDVMVKGVSIVQAIEKINKRLAILVPDPAKLEHFEALKRAYENYKTLEALCELPKPDSEDS